MARTRDAVREATATYQTNYPISRLEPKMAAEHKTTANKEHVSRHAMLCPTCPNTPTSVHTQQQRHALPLRVHYQGVLTDPIIVPVHVYIPLQLPGSVTCGEPTARDEPSSRARNINTYQ